MEDAGVLCPEATTPGTAQLPHGQYDDVNEVRKTTFTTRHSSRTKGPGLVTRDGLGVSSGREYRVTLRWRCSLDPTSSKCRVRHLCSRDTLSRSQANGVASRLPGNRGQNPPFVLDRSMVSSGLRRSLRLPGDQRQVDLGIRHRLARFLIQYEYSLCRLSMRRVQGDYRKWADDASKLRRR